MGELPGDREADIAYGLDAGAAADTCWGGPRDQLRAVTVGAFVRTYWIHVPASYDCEQPVPLVLNYHGAPAIALAQAGLSQMNVTAEREGFIVAYPEGYGYSWNAGICCFPAMFAVDDVAFTRAIIEDIRRELEIDDGRVFATGMSTGSAMAHRLACEMSDVFAAVGTVAAPLVYWRCAPGRPMPIIGFHGTDDWVVPYTGNVVFPPFVPTMEAWARRNGCSTQRHVVFHAGDSTCEAFDGCPAGGEVEMCTIAGGGHTWPGGFPVPFLGKTTYDLSANDRMWQFMLAHAR